MISSMFVHNIRSVEVDTEAESIDLNIVCKDGSTLQIVLFGQRRDDGKPEAPELKVVNPVSH